MPRVDELDVHDIMETELSPHELEPHLTAANNLVDNKLKNKSLASSELKEIERWLAAHFAKIHERRATRESVGPTEFKYKSPSGSGFKSTLYGEQAIALDHTGTLRALSNGKGGHDFEWLGEV